jgi:hypothetical protein
MIIIVYTVAFIFVPYLLGYFGLDAMIDRGHPILQWLWGIVVIIGLSIVGFLWIGGSILIWKYLGY